MDLLSKYVFLPLDIFLKRSQNKTIRNRLEAWLTFLGSDDPEDIAAIVKAYPDFGAMYEQIYEICRNTERVMEMFSEELRILDRNTVRYMMDEMQDEIDQKKKEIEQLNETISQQKKKIKLQVEEISQKQEEISQKQEEISQKQEEISQKQEKISQQKEEISQQRSELEQKDEELEHLRKQLQNLTTQRENL